MKWIIYNRVSTDDQSKNWVSLEYQLNSCLNFVKNNWITVDEKHIFQESYSWAFFDRPKLWEIFKLLKKEKIDCVIVLRRDRLARSVSVFNQIKDIFDTFWVKIFYPEEALTGEEMIDDFMWNTLVWFAQYEKAMILKRTYSWRRTKSKAWKWTTQVPYWYIKNHEWFLELYEPEVKIIKLIVDLYLNDNKSINKIVDYLNENKILPPSMSVKESATQKWVSKRRKNAIVFWGYSSVVRVLDNVWKYYTWEYKAFSTKYKKIWDKTIVLWKRDEEEIILIKIPKIYTKTLVKRLEEKRKINRNHSWKWSTRTYLLKWKLFCDCQPDLRNFVWYTWSKKKNSLVNYRCSMRDKRKASADRICNNSISWLKIDTLVIDTLKDFFLDYNKFKIEYWLNSKAVNDKWNIIDEYKLKILNLKEKEDRALELTLEWLINKDKLKEIQNKVKLWVEKYKNLIHDEYELVFDQYKQGLLDWGVNQYVKELYDFAIEYFEKASYKELKQIVDIMIDKVIVPKDKTKPIRIILNVYPWEFDFDQYLDENKEWYVLREYNKEKTLLNNYQVEFSEALKSEDFNPTDWWDFKFVKLLKEKFKVLFMFGGSTGARTRDLDLKRVLLYQLSYQSK